MHQVWQSPEVITFYVVGAVLIVVSSVVAIVAQIKWGVK